MLNNYEKNNDAEKESKKNDVPVLAMSGKFTPSASNRKYKCSMCGQLLDSKIISAFDHYYLCTGF